MAGVLQPCRYGIGVGTSTEDDGLAGSDQHGPGSILGEAALEKMD